MLANHGLLTVGASVGQAVGFFVLTERVAEIEIKAGAGARVVSDAAAASVRQSMGSAASGDDVFAWLIRSRRGDGTKHDD